MSAWPPAIPILGALLAFWTGWWACRYRHHFPATPVVWPWQKLAQPTGRHAAPTSRDELAVLIHQGRHAQPTNPDGTPVHLDEPDYTPAKDGTLPWFENWPEAHLDGHHLTPADGCMYCTVAAIPMDVPHVQEVPA